MNFKRLSLVAVQAIGLGLLPTAAFAATQSSVFQGTVPASCTITGVNSVTPVDLDYSTDEGGELSGETANIVVNCNAINITATLGPVLAAGGNPAVTTNTAALIDSSESAIIINSSTSADSAPTSLANAANADTNFTVSMTATGANVPGAYAYSVVLTTLE